MKTNLFLIAGLTATLAACNQNTAIGNDREAHLDPPAEASPVEPASSALQNISTALVKPETMSAADIAAIGGTDGRCVYRLTEVGFPTVVYEPNAQAFVKLNGKLIPMQAEGTDRFVSDGLLLAMRTLDDEGNAGLQAQEIIIVPPGAEDELGYRGYTTCEE